MRSGQGGLGTTGLFTVLAILVGCEAQPVPKGPETPTAAPSAIASVSASARPQASSAPPAAGVPAPASVDPSPAGEDAQRAARESLARRQHTSRGGRAFCAVEVFGSRPVASGSFELFVWAHCEEFIRDRGVLVSASGSSMPCTVTLILERDVWRATGVKEAEDGDRHDPSVRAMFSRDAYERMVKTKWNRRALDQRVRDEAERTPF